MTWRIVAGLAIVLAAWSVTGCGSREMEVESENPHMTPEQKALVDQMKRAQEERDRTVSPLPIPQPGQRGVPPPATP